MTRSKIFSPIAIAVAPAVALGLLLSASALHAADNAAPGKNARVNSMPAKGPMAATVAVKPDPTVTGVALGKDFIQAGDPILVTLSGTGFPDTPRVNVSLVCIVAIHFTDPVRPEKSWSMSVGLNKVPASNVLQGWAKAPMYPGSFTIEVTAPDFALPYDPLAANNPPKPPPSCTVKGKQMVTLHVTEGVAQ